MKKMLLILLFISKPFFIHSKEKITLPNALDTVSNELKTHFTDLPFLAKARIAGFSALGASWVWLLTHAFTNTFQAKHRPLDITNLSTWTWPQYVTTPISFVYLSRLFLEGETPEGIAYTANQDGLLKALLSCKTTEETKKILDTLYINMHFPKATAFTHLTSLRSSLQHILKLITTINKHRNNKNFASIATNISENITIVENALLLIKSDPRWFEECNAQTLQATQRIKEAKLNAELANSAIYFAHAYTSRA